MSRLPQVMDIGMTPVGGKLTTMPSIQVREIASYGIDAVAKQTNDGESDIKLNQRKKAEGWQVLALLAGVVIAGYVFQKKVNDYLPSNLQSTPNL